MGAAKVIRRCATYGRKPRTAVAALRQARQFLVDEGKDHWCKGTIFAPNRRKVKSFEDGLITDPDAALCGNWGVCAIGAVELVSDDLPLVPLKEWDPVAQKWVHTGQYDVGGGDNPVISKAIDLLDDATEQVSGHAAIHHLNDASKTRRRDVIRVFDKAIALAEGKA